MQSIRQYRRFGRELQAQYEEDRSKLHEVAGCSRHPSRRSSVTAPRTLDDLHTWRSVRAQVSAARQVVDRDDLSFEERGTDPNNGSSDSSPVRNGAGSDLEKAHTENTNEKEESMSKVGSALGQVMTGVEEQKASREGGGPDRKIFVVGYRNESDSMNPHNWSRRRRWFATINVALIGWIVGFASSIDSSALDKASEEFGVSKVVESLATGLFLAGFGLGALVAGPFSEEFGRNPVYIATLLLYMVFIMASALAPNIGAQLAFRFIGGLFASTPLTCAGGSVSDLWSPIERVYTFPIFANAAFMGPILGPVAGGFIVQSNLSWRWCDWVTLLGSAGVLVMVVLFQPETYPPVLLKWKAAHLRKLTKDDRYVSHAEIRAESFGQRVLHALYRPFSMVFREPILILFGLYLTIVYIILFGFLNGFTFIFTEVYMLSPGLTGLCFLGIVIGLCFASCWIPYIRQRYQRALEAAEAQAEADGKPDTPPKLPPEIRLFFAMFGAPALPLSLFWMGWTARPDVPIWAPLGATVLFGYSILCIFISCYQYLIDSYELYAASALACVTVIRYIAAGAMIEVALPFYGNLTVKWASTLLGCLSALMTPVPYLFYWYGAKIRAKSKFTTG